MSNRSTFTPDPIPTASTSAAEGPTLPPADAGSVGHSAGGREPAAQADGEAAPVGDALPTVELPPISNRGVTVTEFGVHWYQGTTSSHSPEECVALLQALLDGDFAPLPYGGNSYAHSVVGPGGVRVYWTPDRADVLVCLPGEACERLGPMGLLEVYRNLDVLPTRVDLAWDVLGVSPRDVRSAYEAGDIVTKAHRESWSWHENAKGPTFYVGAPSSSRRLRVYDEAHKPDRTGDTRFELQVRGDRAALAWIQVEKLDPDEWSAWCMGFMRDFVDFRDLSSDLNPSRRSLLDWWSAVVAGAQRQRVIIRRKDRTLSDVETWVERQVAPSLALLVAVNKAPQLYLARLIGRGRKRWKGRHHSLLAAA